MHMSVPLLFEYEAVLKQHAVDLGLCLNDIDILPDYWCKTAITHELYYSWRPSLRDPNDDMVLEIAVASGSRYLVTHNLKHFRGAKGFGVRAVTPGTFLKLLED